MCRPCTWFEKVNRYIFTSAVSAGGQTLKRGVQGVYRMSVTSVTLEVSAGKRDCKCRWFGKSLFRQLQPFFSR